MLLRVCSSAFFTPLGGVSRTVPRKGRPTGAPRAPQNRDFTPQNQYGSVEKIFLTLFLGGDRSRPCGEIRKIRKSYSKTLSANSGI